MFKTRYLVTTGWRYLHILFYKNTSLNVPQFNYKALTCIKEQLVVALRWSQAAIACGPCQRPSMAAEDAGSWRKEEKKNVLSWCQVKKRKKEMQTRKVAKNNWITFVSNNDFLVMTRRLYWNTGSLPLKRLEISKRLVRNIQFCCQKTKLKTFWHLIKNIWFCCHKYSWKRGAFTATSLTTTQDKWSSVHSNPSGRSCCCDGNANPYRAGLTCWVEPSRAEEALTGTDVPLEQQFEVE